MGTKGRRTFLQILAVGILSLFSLAWNKLTLSHLEQLKQKGIQFDLEPTNQSWLWREARLKDVDGNQLILFYGGENRLNPPWRIENKTAE